MSHIIFFIVYLIIVYIVVFAFLLFDDMFFRRLKFDRAVKDVIGFFRLRGVNFFIIIFTALVTYFYLL